MGTLQQIRRISPYIFGIFAVLLVAFFTIGDPTVIEGLRGATGSPSAQVLTEVNGDKILYVDYEKRVNDELENLRRQQQQQGQEFTEDPGLRQRVWDQMVDEILLRQQMDKLGIKISDEQVKEQLLDNPPDYLKQMFTDTSGVFMKDVFLELVTRPENYANYLGQDPSKISIEEREAAINNFRKDLISIEKYLRESLARQELQAAISAGAGIISPTYAKLKYKEENSSADIKFIAVTTHDIPQEAIQIKKEEIEKYYNENKHLFKQKSQRRLKYVSMPMVPSSEDSSKYIKRVTSLLDDMENATSDEARDSIFDIKISEYGGINHDYTMVQDIDPNVYSYLAILGNKKIAGPIQKADGTYFYRVDDRRVGESEVVKASHILIKTGMNINEDSAKAEALKLYQSAKSGKEPFALLATEHSEDNGSAPKGGDLGYFKRGTMIHEFDSAAFAGKVGDILGPIKTQFGYHIIRIDDKKNEDLKYSEIKFSVAMSSSSKTKLFRDAVSIQKQVQEGVPFDTVAHRLNLKPIDSPYFEKNKAVLGSRYIVDLAFKSKLGDILDPLELNNYGVVLAIVSDIKETGFKSLEDSREEISQRIGRIKQLDIAKDKAQEIYNKISNAGSLELAASQNPEIAELVKDLPAFKPSLSIPGVGNEAAFSPKAFMLPENKINEPFRGETGYYIVEVKNRVIPDVDKLKTEISKFTTELQQQTKGTAFYQWYQDIKDKAKIEDYRSKFYKEY